jgi:hypothetical protein
MLVNGCSTDFIHGILISEVYWKVFEFSVFKCSTIMLLLAIYLCVATGNTCIYIGHCLVMLSRINSTIITNVEICYF